MLSWEVQLLCSQLPGFIAWWSWGPHKIDEDGTGQVSDNMSKEASLLRSGKLFLRVFEGMVSFSFEFSTVWSAFPSSFDGMVSFPFEFSTVWSAFPSSF